MYNLKAIFDKQPVAIATALRYLLLAAVLLGLLTLDEKQLAGILIAVEAVLGLFVWNAVKPMSSAREDEAQAFASGAEAGAAAKVEDLSLGEPMSAHIPVDSIPSESSGANGEGPSSPGSPG